MQTLKSALSYVQLLRDYGVMKTDMPLKKVCLFWNRVDGREKTALIDLYNQFLREEGFVVLATFLPNSVRFNKEATHNDGAVFRSTYEHIVAILLLIILCLILAVFFQNKKIM